jgi:hypothetical protein
MSDRCDCCGEFEHLKRIDALVDVLKAALPKLVVEAVNALKPELPKLVPNLSNAEWETLKRDEDRRRERAKPLMIVRRTHREWGSRRIELGRLWLIRCAPGHPNRWMIVWRTGLPE